jgi:hypothetical protein
MISIEQFQSGLSTQEFIDSMEVNKERFEDNLQHFTLSFDDRQFFNSHPVSIAAFGMDWCTDVIQFLPVVAKIAEEVPAVTLSIFLRDSNTELMQPYLKEGKYQSIPVFVFYDSEWNELGHFIERPADVTKLMADETRRFAQENKHLQDINRSYEHMSDETRAAVRANSSNFRWNNMDEWNAIFLRDIKAIIAGGAGTPRGKAAEPTEVTQGE